MRKSEGKKTWLKTAAAAGKGIALSFTLQAALLLIPAAILLAGRMDPTASPVLCQAAAAIACLFGGLMAGKQAGELRLMTGCMTGIAVGLLRTMFVIFSGSFRREDARILPYLLLCAAGGALGGMLSRPRRKR